MNEHTGISRGIGVLAMRAVALLLAGLLLGVACHGLLFALVGHDHDHDNCALCFLIHTPVLVAVYLIAFVWNVSARTSVPLIADHLGAQTPPRLSVPRAPPLR